jgi:hypothetical protein
MTLGALLTLLALVVGFYLLLLWLWDVLLRADRDGIDPPNEIDELDIEDGGEGPIGP